MSGTFITWVVILLRLNFVYRKTVFICSWTTEDSTKSLAKVEGEKRIQDSLGSRTSTDTCVDVVNSHWILCEPFYTNGRAFLMSFNLSMKVWQLRENYASHWASARWPQQNNLKSTLCENNAYVQGDCSWLPAMLLECGNRNINELTWCRCLCVLSIFFLFERVVYVFSFSVYVAFDFYSLVHAYENHLHEPT